MRSNDFHLVDEEELDEKERRRQMQFPLLVCQNEECKEPPYCGFEGDGGAVCVFCADREPNTGRVLQMRGLREHKFYAYD